MQEENVWKTRASTQEELREIFYANRQHTSSSYEDDDDIYDDDADCIFD